MITESLVENAPTNLSAKLILGIRQNMRTKQKKKVIDFLVATITGRRELLIASTLIDYLYNYS